MKWFGMPKRVIRVRCVIPFASRGLTMAAGDVRDVVLDAELEEHLDAVRAEMFL